MELDCCDSQRKGPEVADGPRIEFVLEAIQAALAMVRAQPPSQESDRLMREANSLQQTVEGWRRSAPNRALREETMKRVLRLHVGAATLTRLGDPSATAPQTGLDAYDENERPTVPPPFDIEAFAREATSPESERHIDSEPPTQPRQSRAESEILDPEVDRALAPLTQASRPLDPLTEPSAPRRPSQTVATAARGPRTPSPSSIERAVLGAFDAAGASDRDVRDSTAQMLECYALGDYAGAIALADVVLAEAPGSLVAVECRSKSGAALEAIYTARLGPMTRVPTVAVSLSQMDSLGIDHRAGFLLSLIDGSSSVEAILDVCGMPKLDALRILQELIQRGAVRFA